MLGEDLPYCRFRNTLESLNPSSSGHECILYSQGQYSQSFLALERLPGALRSSVLVNGAGQDIVKTEKYLDELVPQHTLFAWVQSIIECERLLDGGDESRQEDG